MPEHRTFTKKNSYPSLGAIIEDNIPFEGNPMGFTSGAYYFDTELMARIVKQFPALNMRLMLGDKLTPLEELGYGVFLSIFKTATGINIHDPSTYQHLIKKE